MVDINRHKLFNQLNTSESKSILESFDSIDLIDKIGLAKIRPDLSLPIPFKFMDAIPTNLNKKMDIEDLTKGSDNTRIYDLEGDDTRSWFWKYMLYVIRNNKDLFYYLNYLIHLTPYEYAYVAYKNNKNHYFSTYPAQIRSFYIQEDEDLRAPTLLGLLSKVIKKFPVYSEEFMDIMDLPEDFSIFWRSLFYQMFEKDFKSFLDYYELYMARQNNGYKTKKDNPYLYDKDLLTPHGREFIDILKCLHDRTEVPGFQTITNLEHIVRRTEEVFGHKFMIEVDFRRWNNEIVKVSIPLTTKRHFIHPVRPNTNNVVQNEHPFSEYCESFGVNIYDSERYPFFEPKFRDLTPMNAVILPSGHRYVKPLASNVVKNKQRATNFAKFFGTSVTYLLTTAKNNHYYFYNIKENNRKRVYTKYDHRLVMDHSFVDQLYIDIFKPVFDQFSGKKLELK